MKMRDNRSLAWCCTAVLLLNLQMFCTVPAFAAKTSRRPASTKAAGSQRSGQTPQVAAYLASTRNKMLSNWMIPDGKNRVVITAMLASDGSVQDSSLSSTPKNAAAEQVANDAFSKAQPFNALPSGVAAPAKLVVTFESSADPHGDSTSNLYTQLFPAQPAKPAATAQPASGTPTSTSTGTTP